MNDVNIELFEKHPNKSFKLITMVTIDLKYPNYFTAIFEDIKTNETYTEKIIPELFRRKFKIGNIYRNNKLLKMGDYLEGTFKINVQHEDKCKMFVDITSKNSYEYDSPNKIFLSKQKCYTYDVGDVLLIIPTNIIAIRYYFLSSSFKKAYNNGDLISLYHKDTCEYFEKDDKCQIDVKKANKKDIPFLCRFLLNRYAYESFTHFFKDKVNTYNKYDKKIEENVSSFLFCRFPIIGSYNIHCRYIPLENTKDNKKVYLVTDIYNDESPLGFSSLHIRRYKEGTPQVEIDNIPYSPAYTGRKKGVPEDNTAEPANPTGGVVPITIIEKAQKDLNTVGLVVTNENIFSGEGDAIEINPEEINTIPTFEEPDRTKDGDEKVQEVLSKEIENIENPFLLSHFTILFEELRQKPDVSYSKLSSVHLMSKIPNTRKRGFNDKSLLNKNVNTPRPYLYGFLQYKEKFVYCIEIQEDISWSQSTWFFVSDTYIEFNSVIAYDIIKKYIHSSGYKELYAYCYSTYKLSLFTKKHTKNIYSEDNIDKWCEEVLRLTDLVNDDRLKRFEKSKDDF